MTINCSLRWVVFYLICTSSLVFSWASYPHTRRGVSSSSSLAVATDDLSRECRNDNTTDTIGGMNRRSAMIVSSSSSIAAFTAAVWTQPAEAVLPVVPSWTLEGGVQMPVMALNTAGLSVGDTERAVTLAASRGITHVDFHPGRERDGVANYLERASVEGTPNQLFLTTKIGMAPKGTSPVEAAQRVAYQIEDDLAILNVKRVDMLMLRDSPDPKVIQSQWAALERALKAGQTRAIGVINFCEFSLGAVLQTCKTKPAVNYCLHHVGMGTDPKGLRSFGESRGIRTFAYGPLGEPGPNKELLTSPVLAKIASNHKVSPERVALRWIVQTGAAVSVRPTLDFGLGTSACPAGGACDKGLAERASTFAWELTDPEMNELSALTSPYDNPTLFSSAGCPDAFGMKEMMKYLRSN
mmetsp:Transcript_36105/g.41207  ORF Transcript_36105/g.41207 Transcript_36105/m.41207 type:complete len:411 (+) Transcript_36105:56-1288(+)